MQKIFIILMALMALSACSDKKFAFSIHKPAALNMERNSGNIAYDKGWKDGCRASLQASNRFYAISYIGNPVQDPKYIMNTVYRNVWRDAFQFCRVYMKSGEKNDWFNNGKKNIIFQ